MSVIKQIPNKGKKPFFSTKLFYQTFREVFINKFLRKKGATNKKIFKTRN